MFGIKRRFLRCIRFDPLSSRSPPYKCIKLENFLTNTAVKDFWKSVYICQSYAKKSSVLFFETVYIWYTLDFYRSTAWIKMFMCEPQKTVCNYEIETEMTRDSNPLKNKAMIELQYACNASHSGSASSEENASINCSTVATGVISNELGQSVSRSVSIGSKH